MNFFFNTLISIDQLGNVIAGGNPDNTISSRVGYYTEAYYKPEDVPWRWNIYKNIINFTFYPIDGSHHCKEAYYNDAGEEFDEGISDITVAILFIIILITCIPISFMLYMLYAFNIVSPKKINRNDNIKRRLRMAEAKLKGVHTELNEYQVDVDEELDSIIEETQKTIEDIAKKINGIIRLNKRLEHFKDRK
ncbi:hypothetical protein ACFFU1_12635 [Algibacter miyuki]|uniref:Uncharacterized protein n=1 Tax=Algibacter miyuki TaxID=1306933 RepID=A0ABV5H1Z5_9FLAO|nr:hypothetical protein [Algibacter miyuki]MDN3666363.1 hypothetical protein [Algibacter miyuki]